MPVIKPYSGPIGKAEILHLLRRTMYGVKKSDWVSFQNKSLSEIIQILISTPSQLPPPPVRAYYNNVDPMKDTLDKINNNGTIETIVAWGETWIDKPIQTNFLASSNNNRRASLKQWQTGLQIHQERNITEKMVMFYQTLLVVEDSNIENGDMMYEIQTLYRKHLLGNYKQLIKDITLAPGMLRYLNGEKNTKAAPDENYARELQELFCVGKGSNSGYTEQDVVEAAKILTGWQILLRLKINNVDTNVLPRPVFKAANHDTSTKIFSSFYKNRNISPNLSLTDPAPFKTIEEKRAFTEVEELIDMIFETEEVSKYICRRLWNYFVYYDITPEIESEVIEPLSELFRTFVHDKNQMLYVLQALFSSEQFFKQEHRACHIKSPIDFHVGIVRQFELPLPDASKLEAQYFMWNYIRSFSVNAGQDINDPPNVAGWPAYYQTPNYHEIWVDTSTYPYRQGAYIALAKSNFALNKNNTYNGVNSPSYGFVTKMNFVTFVKSLDNPSDPNALINEATQLLLSVPLSQSVKDNLKTNYLLLHQTQDYYWTDAWDVYIANPNTSDPESRKVPQMLEDLFAYIMSSAEFHLC